jgi:hypothetical protein
VRVVILITVTGDKAIIPYMYRSAGATKTEAQPCFTKSSKRNRTGPLLISPPARHFALSRRQAAYYSLSPNTAGGPARKLACNLIVGKRPDDPPLY